ncbi:hypothetical protein [Luteimonas abyssi]|uniref:hypothetical protein n=1 Tax=Luteimonas abyssi TaxID=1247514 RepID=UPI000737C2BA|nr:hypothetical protein [Luteimonas abyssi]
MSTIGPDSHLNLTGLDRLSGQVALDELRQQPSGDRVDARDAIGAEAPGAPAVDAGEHVLAATAWGDVAPGERLLSGDLAFEHALAGQDLATAADSATDAILDALG